MRAILARVTVRFPPAPTPEAFRALSREDPRIAAGAGALCRELALGPPALFAAGSLPVYAAGDAHVLKLFPPCFAQERDNEARVLSRVHGRLPLATPGVVARGEADGWRWLVMERIAGTPLDRVWPSLAAAERVRLAREVGRFLRALHALDAGDAAGASAAREGWRRFLAAQEARCVDRQRARGLAPAWLEQIPSFLAATPLAPPERPVLLHTEIMPAHLLAVPGAAGWALTGVVDFEPSMTGAAEYELASVGVFLTCGGGAALRALLRAYGCADADLGPALQRRLLAYTLLHRYSNLRWYLERLPPPRGVATLEALAARWFAVGDEPELA